MQEVSYSRAYMYSIHASGTEQEKERKKAIEFSGNGVIAVVVFLAFSLSV